MGLPFQFAEEFPLEFAGLPEKRKEGGRRGVESRRSIGGECRTTRESLGGGSETFLSADLGIHSFGVFAFVKADAKTETNMEAKWRTRPKGVTRHFVAGAAI